MQIFKKFGPLYFTATYLLVLWWLFKAVSTKFQFCLQSHSSINIIGLLAGLFGLLTLLAYSGHEKGNVRGLGIITFIVGALVFFVVVYRYFGVTTACY